MSESVTNSIGNEISTGQRWVDAGPRTELRTLLVTGFVRHPSSLRAVCTVERVEHTDKKTVSKPRNRSVCIDVNRMRDANGDYRRESPALIDLVNWIPDLAQRYNLPAPAMQLVCQQEAGHAGIAWAREMPEDDVAALRILVERKLSYQVDTAGAPTGCTSMLIAAPAEQTDA